MSTRASFSRAAFAVACTLSLGGCSTIPFRWIPWVGSDRAEPVAAESAPGEIAELGAKATLHPAEPYWPFRIAEIRLEDGDAVQAEAALRQALARDPAHAPSLSLASKLWYDAGRHDEAIAALEGARQRGPLPDLLGVALALHYDAAGDPQHAEQIVASLEPKLADWAAGGAGLAYLRLRGEGFEAAEETARRALDAAPTAVNHNNYGITRLYAGDPETAREHFIKANRLEPELPGPLYNLAIVEHFYRFDTKSARDWFARYREVASDDPDGLEQALSVELARQNGEEKQP
ncbi:MAG: tetratricopeptide repeat protein [Candidatus Eiseniibacteriota bacterium]